jgi:carbon monoxide dehydrogenase subunit G
MNLQGEQLIRAPRARVWAALNDPDMLSRCIPGCEEVKRVGDSEFETRLLAKIGPVRARFGGRVKMSDIVADEGYRISFEGDGGAAGMAKGASQVNLSDDGEGTRLCYTVQAAVGGKLGQIGGRLIDASAKKLADEFFEALNSQLASQSSQLATQGATAAADGPFAAAAPQHPTRAVSLVGSTAASTGAAATMSAWAGELHRLTWLSVGIAIGLVIGRLWPA